MLKTSYLMPGESECDMLFAIYKHNELTANTRIKEHYARSNNCTIWGQIAELHFVRQAGFCSGAWTFTVLLINQVPGAVAHLHEKALGRCMCLPIFQTRTYIHQQGAQDTKSGGCIHAEHHDSILLKYALGNEHDIGATRRLLPLSSARLWI